MCLTIVKCCDENFWNCNLSAKFAKTVLPRNFPLYDIHDRQLTHASLYILYTCTHVTCSIKCRENQTSLPEVVKRGTCYIPVNLHIHCYNYISLGKPAYVSITVCTLYIHTVYIQSYVHKLSIPQALLTTQCCTGTAQLVACQQPIYVYNDR